jgi:predicted PurR-regulated permease PerM
MVNKKIQPVLNAENLTSLAIRVGVWLTFFGIIYVARSFFLLIFLTFVFAYIQSGAVERMARFIPNRPVRVFLSALLLLGVLVSIGSFLLPQVRKEAVGFVEKLPSYLEATDLEIIRVREKYPLIGQIIPDFEHVNDENIEQDQPSAKSPTGILLHKFFSIGDGSSSGASLMHTIDAVRNIGAYIAAIGSAFFLSLLFSFLIVLDLPSLTRSALSLQKTKIGFIYDEVAPSIANFARVLGRAIEAQLFIALLNTFLTGIGLLILGLGSKLAFLSLIVFGCSFIPVAGVFISSLPICLLALQEGGLVLALFAVLLIIVAHMVEAYILNPRIYGHHLRMNPVVVLIILTISGKMFHVWGLILGVPICTYIFGHAIQYRENEEES